MKVNSKDLDRDEILEAIKNGVKEAFLTAMEAGDGISGPTIREPILKALEDGVYMAFPRSVDIKDAIYEAIKDREF